MKTHALLILSLLLILNPAHADDGQLSSTFSIEFQQPEMEVDIKGESQPLNITLTELTFGRGWSIAIDSDYRHYLTGELNLGFVSYDTEFSDTDTLSGGCNGASDCSTSYDDNSTDESGSLTYGYQVGYEFLTQPSLHFAYSFGVSVGQTFYDDYKYEATVNAYDTANFTPNRTKISQTISFDDFYYAAKLGLRLGFASLGFEFRQYENYDTINYSIYSVF